MPRANGWNRYGSDLPRFRAAQAFDWSLLWLAFIFLLCLTAAAARGYVKRWRGGVLAAARGFLHFAAVLLAWLGTAAHHTVARIRVFRDDDVGEDRTEGSSFYEVSASCCPCRCLSPLHVHVLPRVALQL